MSKPLGQKIAIFFAAVSYVAAVGSAFAAYFAQGMNGHDPVRAAWMASVVFFCGCGIVLHVIGKARLKGIVTLPKE